MKTIGNVGPSKNSKGGQVKVGFYRDGSMALFVDSDRGRECTATVCLAPDGPESEYGFVWLKGWTENEGVPEALEKAGIVRRTGETYNTGFVKAELAKIMVPF